MDDRTQRATIIGAGYVGLVTGACLAGIGHDVVVVDHDRARIEGLLAGRMPIFEPGLAELVGQQMDAGRLRFATDIAGNVAGANAMFICVGTPPRPSDGHADMAQVMAAAAEVARNLSGFAAIVVKSTVPVGTGDEVEALVRTLRPDIDVAVVSNPEFLREGVAIDDFMRPDRIVVGTGDARAGAIMTSIYRPLTDAGSPLLITNRRAAELIKYAANSFLALKITYINEIANLCEEIGADVGDVARGIGLDPRIGERFLKPGPGFGGSCFPKDLLALMKTAQDHGVPLRSVETAIAVNDARKGEMVRKIVRAAGGSVGGKTVAVLGLTFKAGTDDMRSSVALVVLPQLQKQGARVVAYDPAGMANAAPLLPGVAMAGSAMTAVAGADLAVILTEWDEFAAIDLAAAATIMRQAILVDLRNLVEPEAAARAGFAYCSIGRAGREGRARPLASAAE
ncbi:MAG: UDPglucose 6-dehydrogenase [Xanthobacteraceae bacterium]|nr:MAG: UDPglucose 6-dehydrogenase [Xanthobacteraceae bacterium]